MVPTVPVVPEVLVPTVPVVPEVLVPEVPVVPEVLVPVVPVVLVPVVPVVPEVLVPVVPEVLVPVVPMVLVPEVPAGAERVRSSQSVTFAADSFSSHWAMAGRRLSRATRLPVSPPRQARCARPSAVTEAAGPREGGPHVEGPRRRARFPSTSLSFQRSLGWPFLRRAALSCLVKGRRGT